MDVFEAIKKRRSIRGYLDKEIESDKLTQILEAAREAPSANNKQEARYIIVKDKETREKLCEAAKGQVFVKEAPVVIACCAKTDNHVMTCGQLCYPIDVAIAIDHMTLAAADLGLGTCWVCAFDAALCRQILNLPDHLEPIALLPLGYPADGYPADALDPTRYETKRKKLDEIVRWI